MIRIMNARSARGFFTLEEIDATQVLLDLAPLLALRVVSWSMFPSIHKGDLIEIGRAHHLGVGDVVLFRGETGLICHRVTAVGADGDVRTRGDASPGPEEPLRPDDVIGTVTAIIRGGLRLSPMRVRRAPAAARLRRTVDLLGARYRARLIAFGRLWLDWLCRRLAVKHTARKLLPRLVRLDIALRVPVRSLSGFRILPLGRHPIEDRILADLPLARVKWEDVLLLARVGSWHLAMYRAATGKVDVRRVAAGLGLEGLLSEEALRVRRLLER